MAEARPTQMSAASVPVASIRSVLNAAWATVRANPWPIVAITIGIHVPINAVLELLPLSDEFVLSEWGRYFRLQRMLEFWIGTMATLAVAHVAVSAHRGRPIGAGEALRRSIGSYGSALLAQFLYNLAFVFGLLLLVIPAFVVGVYGYFALPIIAAKKKSGWAALEHSYRRVRGRWWPFFWRLAGLWALTVCGMVVVTVPIVFVPDHYVVNVLTQIPIDLIGAFLVVCSTELWLQSDPDERLEVTAGVFE